MIKIKLDKRNTNLHTDAGLQLLDKSIDKVGIIESYTISNDGVVISGNARHEKISAKITKEPIVIETDGTEAIIIKRTDIESNTKKFHEASILANTTAHKNFNLDYDVIDEIAEEFDIDIEEVGVEVVELENEPDYSLFDDDDEDLQRQTDQMTAGVKKAIQIEFEAEHYEDAYALVKFWREREAYVGGMIMEYLKTEKEKI